MATLYIVATPIGNLEDISQRALRVLSEVDLILCEDTRVTKKLLNYYNIKTPLLSYHQHSSLKKINYILSLLKENRNLALLSDSGTPGISDPGNELIELIIKKERKGEMPRVKIVPIPGPSALITAASVSGFSMNRFVFLGFPPVKKKRKKFLKEIIQADYPVIFYESPYRILRTLNELNQLSQSLNFKVQVVVCRELTKKFETIYRGEIKQVIKEIERDKIKGEFVVIVTKEKANNTTNL